MTETMTMVPADVKPFARSLKGPPVVCGGFGGAPFLSLSLSLSRSLSLSLSPSLTLSLTDNRSESLWTQEQCLFTLGYSFKVGTEHSK